MLRTGDRERCTGKIDLQWTQVANLGSPQPVPEANRIMVWSRCGCRLPSHPSISFSTSFSVRYSRVLTSAFLGRRGVTFRFTVAGDTIFRVGFVIWISFFLMMRLPTRSQLLPYTTLFRFCRC